MAKEAEKPAIYGYLWELKVYARKAKMLVRLVRVVSDAGCERIQEEKKVQSVKFFYPLSKKGEELGMERNTSTEEWGL